MTRRDWCYTAQQIWEQEEMTYKAMIYRDQMIKKIPQLTFRRKNLIPFDVVFNGQFIILYYPPVTQAPTDQRAWQDQMEAQSFRLLGYARDDQDNLVVRCMRLGE